MICKQCGKEIPEGTKFCPFCGAENAANEPKQADAPAPAPAAEPEEIKPAEAASPAPSEAQSKDAEPKKDEAPKVPEEKAKKPKKKRKKWPLVLLIIIIILAAGGYYYYDHMPSTQAEKLVKEAAAAYSQGDLKTAVGALRSAREVYPDKAADYEEIIASYYEGSAAELATAGEYEKAIALIEEEQQVVLAKKDDLYANIASYYTSWADKVFETGDALKIKEMHELLEKKSMTKGLESLAQADEKFEAFLADLEARQAYTSFAKKIGELIEKEAWDDVYAAMRADLFTFSGEARSVILAAAVAPEKYLPLIEDLGNGKKLGLYVMDSRYYLYYGEYSGEMRSGTGTWISVINKLRDDQYQNYRATCQWADDAPNGSFTSVTLKKTASMAAPQTQQASGSVKSGLYEGSITLRYDDSPEMKGSFSAGRPRVIMTKDPNGNSAFVIAISDDQKTWLSSAEGPNGIHGIMGYK